VEDGRNNSLGLDFEVQASLARQAKKLLDHEAGALLEDRVDDRVDKARMSFVIVLSH